MKTICIEKNIYTFDELTDEAKENALEYFRTSEYALSWQEENYDTVKEIARLMDWNYSTDSYDGVQYEVNYTIEDSDIADLSGARAMAYIQNNYIKAAQKPKTYWLNHVLYCDGRKNWTRKSQINFEIDNCPFTGYIMDCCFAGGWREWLATFTKDSTVQDFADMVASHLSKEWTNDNEYQLSDEAIIETINANEYEFESDGSVC